MQKSMRIIVILVTLALFIGACLPAPTQPQEPQAQDTQSSQDVQSQIATAVAQTIEAQNQIWTSVAQTIEAQATPTFTATPFVIPTVFVPTVTPRPSTGGGGGTVIKADYVCDVINRRPFDNTEFSQGDTFDIKWTIVNTGAKSWPSGFDVKYSTGPHMATVNVVEIPVVMDPGDQYQIVMDAFAPNEKGKQIEIWTVQGQLCFPYVAIVVK